MYVSYKQAAFNSKNSRAGKITAPPATLLVSNPRAAIFLPSVFLLLLARSSINERKVETAVSPC